MPYSLATAGLLREKETEKWSGIFCLANPDLQGQVSVSTGNQMVMSEIRK